MGILRDIARGVMPLVGALFIIWIFFGLALYCWPVALVLGFIVVAFLLGHEWK